MLQPKNTSADPDAPPMPNRVSDCYPWHPDRVVWKRQTGLEKLQADAALIAEFYKVAEHVPILKAALDWADRHGVSIMIDPDCKGAGGYYWFGSGVVVLSQSALSSDGGLNGVIIGYLVHEMRHAWQDFYGMMIDHGDLDFDKQFIQVGLYEADAYAHGSLASAQYDLHRSQIHLERMEANKGKDMFVDVGAGKQVTLSKLMRDRYVEQQRELSDQNAFLQNSFREWYDDDHTTAFYGAYVSKSVGQRLGVPDVRRDHVSYTFKKAASPKHVPGIGTDHKNELMRLGKGFTHGNYLRGIDWDWLVKEALSPSRAKRFFQQDDDGAIVKVPALVTEMEKRERTLRLHKSALKRL